MTRHAKIYKLKIFCYFVILLCRYFVYKGLTTLSTLSILNFDTLSKFVLEIKFDTIYKINNTKTYDNPLC